jgi:hypothetical protein
MHNLYFLANFPLNKSKQLYLLNLKMFDDFVSFLNRTSVSADESVSIGRILPIFK